MKNEKKIRKAIQNEKEREGKRLYGGKERAKVNRINIRLGRVLAEESVSGSRARKR